MDIVEKLSVRFCILPNANCRYGNGLLVVVGLNMRLDWRYLEWIALVKKLQ